MKLIFFSKCAKFYIDFEKSTKVLKKLFDFDANGVRMFYSNLSELWGEYMLLAMNVLASSANIWDPPKKEMFSTSISAGLMEK